MPGGAKSTAGSSVHEDVVLGGAHVGAIVNAEKRARRASAEANAGRAVVDQINSSEDTVACAGQAHPHAVQRPVASGQMFILARECDLHRPPCLLGQMGSDGRIRQAGSLAAEVAADELVRLLEKIV